MAQEGTRFRAPNSVAAEDRTYLFRSLDQKFFTQS